MSERVFEGLATVSQQPQRGMVTLRGDLSAAKFKKAVAGVSGLDVPGMGACVAGDARTVAWMSPDELLLMGPHESVGEDVTALEKALKGTHHLVQDVSDARAIYRIEGAACRDVVAKLCPVDLAPDAFGPGKFRRTRIAQVACAFWMPDEASFELVAFTSVADYVWGVLNTAADPGSAVGHFA
ncbi:MAG: sarcosine oxidase subunit gamma family protein [Pseudomonadota bacterium]